MIRTHQLAGAVVLFALLAPTSAAAQAPEPAAFVREDSRGFYIAVYADPAIQPKTRPAEVLVFRKGQLIETTLELEGAYGASFTARLPRETIVKDGAGGLTVVVSRYRTSPEPTPTASFTVTAALDVSVKINTGVDPWCLAVSLQVEKTAKSNEEHAESRLKEIADYVKANRPSIMVDPQASSGPSARQVTHYTSAATTELVRVCFAFSPEPPKGNYDIQLSYDEKAPVELRPFVVKTGLTSAVHGNAPVALDSNGVGKRALEQNLDVAVQFSSSSKTENGVVTTTRRGTLDLRLAPVLNVLPTPKEASNTIWSLTPFFIDARVSTGDVNKDTLSSNRIVFGGEFERRQYHSEGDQTFPTYHRLIMGFRNAADRDFKQAEWKAVVEYQPVAGALNKPLKWRVESKTPKFDPSRGPSAIPSARKIGWQFLPAIGLEVGRTWREGPSFAAIETSPVVRRIYLGGTVNLDLTRYVAISISDKAYVRGEVDEDQLRNYLVAKVEVPLAGFSSTNAHSIFLSYERGALPPFSTPDVNALKLGYRFQWDGWLQSLR